MFRSLMSDEIECRVQSIKQGKGFSMLLYKDARCDMNILDECVGAENWTRAHSRDNKNCTVSIWDEKKQQWISKEDTGSESNADSQKGLASDSFKRACVNWGIGRELYTSPFIWISDTSYIKNDNKVYEKFHVSNISVFNGAISGVEICDSKGKKVYTWGNPFAPTQEPQRNKTMMKPEHCKHITDMIISNSDNDDGLMDRVLERVKVKDFKFLEDKYFDRVVAVVNEEVITA